MRIAITAHGENLWSPVDSRLGRADHVVIYDQEANTWECLANKQYLEATHGAGIQAGQALTQAGVNVLITGHIGLRAFKVLNKGNIDMYEFGDFRGSVHDALAEFLDGKLTAITAAHWFSTKK